MLGVGLTVDRDRVMVGAKGAKFGKKGRFGKLVVKNKKGEEAEERERRGGGFLPWTPISTIGALYDDYNGSYVLC